MSTTKINTAISTKTSVSQEHVVQVVTKTGTSFGMTASQVARCSAVSEQLKVKSSNTIHLAECGEMAHITDAGLKLALDSCTLAQSHGTGPACARGGVISELLIQQETKKVMDYAVAVRLLGCSFAFGISADVFKTRIAGCQSVAELNLALGFAFDFKMVDFHRIIKQTKWYLRMKVDGFCEWIHNLWIAVKTGVKTSIKLAWREFKAAITHTAITIQTTVCGALHALFCEIIPSLHAEVVARLSMTCSWLRDVCLPTMYGVLVVRPGLWLQAKHCEFRKQLDKFFGWFELHRFVLKLEFSAKVEINTSAHFKKLASSEVQCKEFVAAADHTFARVQEHRHQFTSLYKCVFNNTAVSTSWSQSVAKLDLKCVQVKKPQAIVSGSAVHGAQTSARVSVDTLIVDSRDLTSQASSLFLYKGVKVLRVGVKFTRDVSVSQKSGIYLVTAPAGKSCTSELSAIRVRLSEQIQQSKILVGTTVTEVRYEFIEKETNLVLLTSSDLVSRSL